MSLTITTDVFCDGELPDGQACMAWEHGVAGARSDATEARRQVHAQGWTRRKGPEGRRVDLCPTCSSQIDNAY